MRQNEDRPAIARLKLQFVLIQMRALLGIDRSLALQWHFVAGLVEVLPGVSLRSPIILARGAGKHPLAVVKRVGPDPRIG
jgi:hypothetical protein